MKKYVILFVVFISFSSCFSSSSESNRSIESESVYDTTKNVKTLDTTLYINIGDPDTALVLFLYTQCYNYDYDLQREEYIRWDKEKTALSKLYKEIFSGKPDHLERLSQVERNSITFLSAAGEVVKTDYENYRAVSGTMETTFLFEKRDDRLKKILEKMVLDSTVSKEEGENARGLLMEWSE